jgi:hypothetical protein
MQLPSTASSSATPRDATPNPGSVSFNPTNTKNPTKPSPDGNLLHTLKRHWKQTAQVMRRPKEKPMTYQQQQEHYKKILRRIPRRTAVGPPRSHPNQSEIDRSKMSLH